MVLSLLLLIVPCIAVKFCVDCKHFKKDRFSSNEFGRCGLFPYEVLNDDYLVTGKRIVSIEYTYCSFARTNEEKCGKEGIHYDKKQKYIDYII